jgi:hypothetical protein
MAVQCHDIWVQIAGGRLGDELDHANPATSATSATSATIGHRPLTGRRQGSSWDVIELYQTRGTPR